MENMFIHCLALLLLVATSMLVYAKKEQGDKKSADQEAEDKKVGTVIGIDLGTTYSCVGVFRNGKVDIIANDQGNRITPSYVAFTPEGDRLIGDAAKNQLTSNPVNTIFGVKRFIGRKWSEPSVQRDSKFYPFKMTPKDNKPYIEANTADGIKTFSPEEISAMVLSKMKEIAEDFLGKKIENAVITVPAYFNDAQRSATKDAGTIAGLNVLRIINEPTAAAIAYGIDQKEGEKSVLVFDLGGGTFDVSILTIDNGVFEVVATNGNTHLGGEDFDQRVMEYFIKMYKKKTNKDVTKDNRAVQKLRREVEKAKRTLSSATQCRLEIESFFEGEDFSESLTRAKFEELNMDLFNATLIPLKSVLEDSGRRPQQIDEIVLVGGSTRIPKVQQLVSEFFNGKEPSLGINPDEAVAFGAAVQGGVLSGDEDTGDVVLLDVNPLTLGVEVHGGAMSSLIPRNTVIPTKKSQTYSTSIDNQETVIVRVYEGERPLVKDNHLLGTFSLSNIVPAPRGLPQIDVTFDVDVNGILTVTAEDKGTGSKSHITITNDESRLSQEDIERMINDAEKFSDDDKQIKERTEKRAELEKNVYSLRRQLKDESGLGGKLTEAEHKQLSETIEEYIVWLDNNLDPSAEDLLLRKDKLDKLMEPVLQSLYAQNAKKDEDEDDDDDDDDNEKDEL